MIITIENEKLKASVNTRGAELISLVKDGEEFIWQRDKKYWGSCAPVLFPMVSSSLDGYYTHNGKTYPLPSHGFARDCEFDVVEQSDASVVLRLVQNHLTAVVYPFKYDFFVSFSLIDGKLDVNYIVKNLSETETMYFNTGAHEGFNLFDGGDVGDYYIEFEKKEKLLQLLADKPVWDGRTHDFGESNTLELDESLFAIDGVFFTDIKSKYVILKSKKSDRAVRVDFAPGNLGFWKTPNSGYLCIEPWDGFFPFEGDSHEISEKRFIKSLNPCEEYKFNHTIEII